MCLMIHESSKTLSQRNDIRGHCQIKREMFYTFGGDPAATQGSKVEPAENYYWRTTAVCSFPTAEGVTDGETECRDDEHVKWATFTHLLLYCLSLQEWSEGARGKTNRWVQGHGPPEPHSPANRP